MHKQGHQSNTSLHKQGHLSKTALRKQGHLSKTAPRKQGHLSETALLGHCCAVLCFACAVLCSAMCYAVLTRKELGGVVLNFVRVGTARVGTLGVLL